MASEPSKILHVFSTFEVGGSQRRFATYLANTQKQHQHYVYAMDGCYDAAALAPDVKLLKDSFPAIPKGRTLAAIRAARRALKQIRPDLLVTYNWGATEWVLANSFAQLCPTIHIQDGFGEDEQNREKTLRRSMRSFAYKRCTKVIVPSKTLYNLAQDNWGISQETLTFIPNGIELNRFARTADKALCKSLGIDDSKKIIGTLAALRPEKNIGRLIEAYSLVEDTHPDSQLVIVGDGIGMSALKMLAERVCTKGRVIFTGNLSKPEQVLPIFDIFSLSSDTEQMPLSVIEAMATGLPVVSTDVGDIKQMVSTENLQFIEGQDADILAKHLSTLLEDATARQSISQSNKAKATAEYGLDQMVAAYDELFTHPLD